MEENDNELDLHLMYHEHSNEWELINYHQIYDFLARSSLGPCDDEIEEIIHERVKSTIRSILEYLSEQENIRVQRLKESKNRFREIESISYYNLNDTDKKSTQCSICLEDFKINRRRKVMNPCECCVFHSICLKKWAKFCTSENITCPNCNKKI